MRRAASHIDRDIRAIAADQLGVLSTAQAASVSISPQSISLRRSSGAVVALYPGVVAVGGSSAPLQRILAAALAVDGAIIAGPSAGVVLGLPVGKQWAGEDAPVVLNVPSKRVVRVRGVVPVRSSVLMPSRPWMGVRTSTPAAVITMLPKFVDNATVERCLDYCLIERLTTVAAVAQVIQDQPYRAVTGRALLFELLAARDGSFRHRSKLEQRVGGWLDAADLDGWRSNYLVHTANGERIEVDFAWLQHKVALEISPFYTHGTQAKQARDMKRRQLLLGAGWKVVEASDMDLADAAAFSRIVDLLRLLVR